MNLSNQMGSEMKQYLKLCLLPLLTADNPVCMGYHGRNLAFSELSGLTILCRKTEQITVNRRLLLIHTHTIFVLCIGRVKVHVVKSF